MSDVTQLGKYQPYPDYKNSGVEWLGEIPDAWELWKLAHAYDVIGSGTTPPTNEDKWFGDGVPWVTTGELRETVVEQTTKNVTFEALNQFSALKIHPAGSVVIAMYGATIGRLGVLGIDATTNQACCVLTQSQHLYNQYVFYWLYAFRDEIIKLSSGGGQPNINQEKVASLKITAPDYSHQKKIVSFLDYETARIDQLIAKQQQLIELLKEKRQAVISHAVTKGLNPNAPMKDSGVEWLGQVPEHWVICKIKNLASVISKGTTPSTIGAEFIDEGVRFLKAENIGKSPSVNSDPEFFISEGTNKQISRSQLKENDVLVIIAGATTGAASILQKEMLPANTNQAVSFIRPVKRVFSKWMLSWLATDFSQRVIWMGAVQAAQPNLSMESLGNIPITLPPESEIQDIISTIDFKLNKFEQLTNKAEETISLMQERRTALISAAVTGKIDLRGWQLPKSEVAA
ncbi:restriction endonuclease subunit S [Aeromonas veronii]|uniref:restriction endonuclease subunit S n=1 Tax=Aeromonas veronii TaxID=654 RepID=UPI00217EDDC6|nr:restriction endonuclease subunit S [Aeromonas veronii]UWH26814.1 restriction endonuclease subunit S [Aeromonas veronii]